jgi:hypothetical protein
MAAPIRDSQFVGGRLLSGTGKDAKWLELYRHAVNMNLRGGNHLPAIEFRRRALEWLNFTTFNILCTIQHPMHTFAGQRISQDHAKPKRNRHGIPRKPVARPDSEPLFSGMDIGTGSSCPTEGHATRRPADDVRTCASIVSARGPDSKPARGRAGLLTVSPSQS